MASRQTEKYVYEHLHACAFTYLHMSVHTGIVPSVCVCVCVCVCVREGGMMEAR